MSPFSTVRFDRPPRWDTRQNTRFECLAKLRPGVEERLQRANGAATELVDLNLATPQILL
jgi:hypothetical protein